MKTLPAKLFSDNVTERSTLTPHEPLTFPFKLDNSPEVFTLVNTIRHHGEVGGWEFGGTNGSIITIFND